MRQGGGLASHERVRRRPDFERAYAEGLRVRARYMTVFAVANACSHLRLGVAASRKLGPAVDRNRAKRLARELFRRHKAEPVFELYKGLDLVVVPRREMLDAPFSSLQLDYRRALDRCHPIVRAGHAAARRGGPAAPQGL